MSEEELNFKNNAIKVEKERMCSTYEIIQSFRRNV